MQLYVGCLLMLFSVALNAGHAAGQSPGCLNPSSAPVPAFAAEQAQAPLTALETQVWKTIIIGGSKGVNAVRQAIETAPCPVAIGDDADEILGRPSFPFIKQPVELDLVALSVFELGFGDKDARNDVELGASVEVSLRDIYARAVSLGFELSPAEVGPALRLQYLDQPHGEFLQIANISIVRHAMPSAWPRRSGPDFCSMMQVLMSGNAASWAAKVNPAGPHPTIRTSTSSGTAPEAPRAANRCAGSEISGSPASNPFRWNCTTPPCLTISNRPNGTQAATDAHGIDGVPGTAALSLDHRVSRQDCRSLM
jgi:hypothetical protein